MQLKKRTIFLLAGLVVGVVAAVAVGFDVLHRGLSARDQPSNVETHIARATRRLAVVRKPSFRRAALRPPSGI